MVYVGSRKTERPFGWDFALLRNVDGFESKIDKSQTLDMLIKQLEYDPNRLPYNIKIITGDEEKYEVEPVDAVGDVTAMMDTAACCGNKEEKKTAVDAFCA